MNYLVVKADLEKNRNDILSLWGKNFPELPPERYDWIYYNNPDGKALNWIALENCSGSFVGTTSIFPRTMKAGSELVLAGIAGDFAVNRENRGTSIAVMLQRAVTTSINQNNLKLIYGFPNRKAELVQLRAGYISIGRISRWAKLLKTNKFLKTPVLQKVVSRPLDFMMKGLSKETRYRGMESYATQISNSFDQRFDQFWVEASKQFNIIAERSKDHLNWRYLGSPHKEYCIFLLTSKDHSDIYGYIVYYLKDKVGFIADMLFLNFGAALETLLSEFILHLRSQNVESISILLFGCPPLAEKLKTFGFHLRERESNILVYLDKDFPFRDLVLNENNWFLLEGDRDI
jgi:hypothetical protein